MSSENPYAPPESDVVVEQQSTLAGRWARLGGSLIDGVLAVVIISPLMYASGYWETVAAGGASIGNQLAWSLFAFILFLALNGYLLATAGQTVGKRLVGTRIVSVEDDRILSFGKVIGLRYVPTWVISQVPGLGALFGLVDALFIFRGDRRCIHDLIAGTRVIYASGG